MYEKNGVITEERFKNLTQSQWLFHYKEIVKNKKEHDTGIDYAIQRIENYLLLIAAGVDEQRTSSFWNKLQKLKDEDYLNKPTDENDIEIMNNAPKMLKVSENVFDGSSGVPKKNRDSILHKLEVYKTESEMIKKVGGEK